jgi:hypothetical protein
MRRRYDAHKATSTNCPTTSHYTHHIIISAAHRIDEWCAGGRDYCFDGCEPQWTRGRGEGAAGVGRGRDGSACESVAGHGMFDGGGRQGRIVKGQEDSGQWVVMCVCMCCGQRL